MLDQRLPLFGNLEIIFLRDNVLVLKQLNFVDNIDRCKTIIFCAKFWHFFISHNLENLTQNKFHRDFFLSKNERCVKTL